eukprot:5248582-Pleurochrysis_carterae.AAC.1
MPSDACCTGSGSPLGSTRKSRTTESITAQAHAHAGRTHKARTGGPVGTQRTRVRSRAWEEQRGAVTHAEKGSCS